MICRVCSEHKEIEEFSKNTTYANSHSNRCKSCDRIYRISPSAVARRREFDHSAKRLEQRRGEYDDLFEVYSGKLLELGRVELKESAQRVVIQAILDALQFSYAESSRFHTGRWRDINESVRAAIELAKTLQPARETEEKL